MSTPTNSGSDNYSNPQVHNQDGDEPTTNKHEEPPVYDDATNASQSSPPPSYQQDTTGNQATQGYFPQQQQQLIPVSATGAQPVSNGANGVVPVQMAGNNGQQPMYIVQGQPGQAQTPMYVQAPTQPMYVQGADGQLYMLAQPQQQQPMQAMTIQQTPQGQVLVPVNTTTAGAAPVSNVTPSSTVSPAQGQMQPMMIASPSPVVVQHQQHQQQPSTMSFGQMMSGINLGGFGAAPYPELKVPPKPDCVPPSMVIPATDTVGDIPMNTPSGDSARSSNCCTCVVYVIIYLALLFLIIGVAVIKSKSETGGIGGVTLISLIVFPAVLVFWLLILLCAAAVAHGCICLEKRYYQNYLPSKFVSFTCDPMVCAAFNIFKPKKLDSIYKKLQKMNKGTPMLFFAVNVFKSKQHANHIKGLHLTPVFKYASCSRSQASDLSRVVSTTNDGSVLHLYPAVISSYQTVSYTPSSPKDDDLRRAIGNDAYLEMRYGYQLSPDDQQWIEKTKQELITLHQCPKHPQSIVEVELVYVIHGVTSEKQYKDVELSGMNAIYGAQLGDGQGYYDKYRITGVRPITMDFKNGSMKPMHLLNNDEERYKYMGSLPKPYNIREKSRSCWAHPWMFTLSVILGWYPLFNICWRSSSNVPKLSYYHINQLQLAHQYMMPEDHSYIQKPFLTDRY